MNKPAEKISNVVGKILYPDERRKATELELVPERIDIK